MLVAGFDGHELPSHVEGALRRGELGGIILFRRNVGELSQVVALVAGAYSSCPDRLPIVSIDQEGGRVQRIREPATVIPPMSWVGAVGDPDLAVRVGQVIGEELEALGFNVNFAPVADAFTNPANTVIGDRAFGADPVLCGRMAGSIALGLTMSGIAPCAKHFPGHGDTIADSHLELPRVDHDLGRLRAVELKPFEMLVKARIPMVMTAHLLVPALDSEFPFTLSPRGVSTLLRGELGFQGVVVSDDLEMKAVADRFEIDQMMELGVTAGVDLFLICHTHEKWVCAYEALVRLGEASSTMRDRMALSARRIAQLETGYFRPWVRPESITDVVGSRAHLEVIAELHARAQ